MDAEIAMVILYQASSVCIIVIDSENFAESQVTSKATELGFVMPLRAELMRPRHHAKGS